MTIPRRTLLGGTAALALTACDPGENPTDPPPSPTESTSPGASPSPTATYGPFGLRESSEIRATVVPRSGGDTAVEAAGDLLKTRVQGLDVQVSKAEDVKQEIGPTLAKEPPDLIHNGGDHPLALGEIGDDLLALEELLGAEAEGGTEIRDTLYSSALPPGRVDDKQLAIPYALVVHGLWYSEAAFAEHGWAVPATWDATVELAEAVEKEERHLFSWDDTTVLSVLDLAITSAVKEAGHELRRALDNLADGAWSHPAVEATFEQLRLLVTEQHFVEVDHGAKQRWAVNSGPVLFCGGAHVINATRSTMQSDFLPTVAPVPTLTAAPTLPIQAIRAAADESFVVPKKAKNTAGGLEMLRTMLSREVAAQYSAKTGMPTVVRGATAQSESPELATQTRLLAGAGEHVVDWRFLRHYGLGEDAGTAMSEFLRGTLNTPALITRLQALTDAVRNDPRVKRYTAE